MANCGKNPDYAKTKAYKDLKKYMLDSLAQRGLNNPIYTDKVTEYMDFWVRRRQLKDDILARGLVVLDDRGRPSENRSISMETQVSRHMMSVFCALGFDKCDHDNADDEL